MAVTALIPIVLFPWLGVMHSKDICVNYLKVRFFIFIFLKFQCLLSLYWFSFGYRVFSLKNTNK